MGAEDVPEGLLDFAGSSKCVATEVYLHAAKPVLVPATAGESMFGGRHGRLWYRDRASRRRCGLTFRSKSLMVLRLLCLNSEFPHIATLMSFAQSESHLARAVMTVHTRQVLFQFHR